LLEKGVLEFSRKMSTKITTDTNTDTDTDTDIFEEYDDDDEDFVKRPVKFVKRSKPIDKKDLAFRQ